MNRNASQSAAAEKSSTARVGTIGLMGGAQRQALLVGIAVVTIWGAGYSVQKSVYQAMQPGPFLFFRSLLMGLCALAVLRQQRLPWWPRLQAGESWPLVRAALLGPLLHVFLVTYAIHWTTPFTSAVIMACGPVITLLLLRLIEGSRLRPLQMAGIATAAGGVLLFLADKLMQADLRASGGDLMMLVATVFFSLHTIRVTPLVQRHGGLPVMCWTTLLATPGLLLLSVGPTWQAPVTEFPPWVWVSYLWTVLVTAFLSWMLWSWVNSVRGVARTAPLLYLVPPVAGLVGWLFLGEALTVWKLAGGVLAMMGVALVQIAQTRSGS